MASHPWPPSDGRSGPSGGLGWAKKPCRDVRRSPDMVQGDRCSCFRTPSYKELDKPCSRGEVGCLWVASVWSARGRSARELGCRWWGVHSGLRGLSTPDSSSGQGLGREGGGLWSLSLSSMMGKEEAEGKSL